VLRALRRLTGQDFGDKAADWRTGLGDAARLRTVTATEPGA
jgi:hypothetical protein